MLNVCRSLLPSLSARRAWIEIDTYPGMIASSGVALRKESVDRNFDAVQIVIVVVVALRKESVDRNAVTETIEVEKLGRSPQGERG